MDQCHTCGVGPVDWESQMSDFQHDVRTPLNAMMGFAQLIAMSEELPEEAAAHAEAIVSSGQDMLALIARLEVAANRDAPPEVEAPPVGEAAEAVG